MKVEFDMVALASKPDKHYRDTVALLMQLHELMCEGKSETDEADELRDRLDVPWKRLSDDEMRRIRNVSADLASIEPDSPFKHPNKGGILRSNTADRIQRARQANQYEEILRYFVSMPKLSPSIEQRFCADGAMNNWGSRKLPDCFSLLPPNTTRKTTSTRFSPLRLRPLVCISD